MGSHRQPPQWQPPPPEGQPVYPPTYPPYGPPPVYVYPPAPIHRSMTDAWCLVAATAGAAVGVFLPWATITLFGAQVSLNGSSSGDGQVYLVAAVVCAVFALLIATGNGNKKLAIITLIGGSLIGLGGLYDQSNISHIANGSAGIVQVGFGLYLTLACGFGMLVLSIVVLCSKAQ